MRGPCGESTQRSSRRRPCSFKASRRRFNSSSNGFNSATDKHSLSPGWKECVDRSANQSAEPPSVRQSCWRSRCRRGRECLRKVVGFFAAKGIAIKSANAFLEISPTCPARPRARAPLTVAMRRISAGEIVVSLAASALISANMFNSGFCLPVLRDGGEAVGAQAEVDAGVDQAFAQKRRMPEIIMAARTMDDVGFVFAQQRGVAAREAVDVDGEDVFAEQLAGARGGRRASRGRNRNCRVHCA